MAHSSIRRRSVFCLAAWVAGLVLAMAAPTAAADRDTRLADAAMRRDVTTVRTLIGQKVDANVPGQDGTPGPSQACWPGSVDGPVNRFSNPNQQST